VSLLQELCVKKGITPKYDLVQIEGAVHEPTFKYRVTVGGQFSEFGSGQSKKKAKHYAAKSILDKLLNSSNEGILEGEVASDIVKVISPYDDGIQGNPVGTLQELCMSRRWPPPVYDLSSEDGLPHERQFTIYCVVGKHRESGAGKSKKLAKRQAAFKMMQKLKEIPMESSQTGPAVDDDDEISNMKGTNRQTSKATNQRVSQFHKLLKNSTGDNTKQLQEAKLDDDPVEMLSKVCEELKVDVTYVKIEETSRSGRKQCLVQLSTQPLTVCFGDGETIIEADNNAAINTLQYLKIMTKLN